MLKNFTRKRIQPPDLRTGGRLKSVFYAKLSSPGIEGRPQSTRVHVRQLAEAGAAELGQGVHREGATAVEVAEQIRAAGIVEHRTLLEVVLDVGPGNGSAA